MAGAGPGGRPVGEAGAISDRLASAVEAALPGWVERSVVRVLDSAGLEVGSVLDEARDAGRLAASRIGGRLRQLLSAPFAEQAETPLALVRLAVRYPTEVLERAGAPPARRDSFSVSAFPDDVYDLTPASLADIDEELAEVGLFWGAAKAADHLGRSPGAASGREDGGGPATDDPALAEPAPGGVAVAAYVPDLMDRSRLSGRPGIVFVDELEELVPVSRGARTVVVDLTRPGVLELIPELGPARVVGFAPHVEEELLERARESGCADALPRSLLFRRFDSLVRGEGPGTGAPGPGRGPA